MYLFKTSGSTLDSVIANQKHAFFSKPRNLLPGELILISKNKRDCKDGEKQIQYTMRFESIRRIKVGEVEKYWPGNEGRWRFLVNCYDVKSIPYPFDLDNVLGPEALHYSFVVTHCKIKPEHEKKIITFLSNMNAV